MARLLLPAAGVVLDIPRDETFTAVHGGGAYRNGAAIRVSRIAVPGRRPDWRDQGVPERVAQVIQPAN